MARKCSYQTMYERQKYDQNAFSFSIAIVDIFKMIF